MASDKSGVKASKPKKQVKSKSVAKPALSDEIIIDSETSSSSDNDSGSDEPEAPARVTSLSTDKGAKKRKIDVATEARVPKTNGTSKRKEDSSSSEDDSEDEEADDAMVVDAVNEEETSESSEEESSDDGVPLATPQKQSSKSIAATSIPTHTSSGVVNDWKPPSGYERIRRSSQDHSRVTKRLTAKALKGKQLWHVTVPSGVDISKIPVIQPEMLEHGSAALTGADGGQYKFVTSRKRNVEGVRILVPEGEKDEYTQLDMPVSRTLDLRQVMEHDPTADDEEDEGQEQPPRLDPKLLVAQKKYPKPAPPVQPTGLLIHNFPIGVKAPIPKAKFKKPATNGSSKMDVDATGGPEDAHSKSKQDETPEERAARRALKKQKKAAKATK